VTSDFRNGTSTSSAAASSTASSSAPSGAVTTGSTSGGGASHDTGDQGYSLLMASYELQDQLAKTTGGHAFHSNNGLKELLDNVVEEGANYYTLSYSPSNKNYNGNLRTIKVELAKHGYQLAYRRSYYGTTLDAPRNDKNFHVVAMPESEAPRKLGDSLYANMQHGAPLAHQLYFRAQIHPVGTEGQATPEQMANLQDQPAYFRARRKNKPVKELSPVRLQTYLVEYTVMAQSKAARNGRPSGFEIAAAAYDAEGRMLNGEVANASAPNPTPSAEGGKGFYRAQQPIDVPVGATSIRIAVRDVSTDRIGAMEVTLPLAAEPQTQASTPPSAEPAPAKQN
jgi:hypothetical protein